MIKAEEIAALRSRQARLADLKDFIGKCMQKCHRSAWQLGTILYMHFAPVHPLCAAPLLLLRLHF